MMDFKLFLESELEKKAIPFSDLIMSRNSLFAAMNNISRGCPSKSTGPVDVLFIDKDRYQLIDGYHRAFADLLFGKDFIESNIYRGYSDYWAIARGNDIFKYNARQEFKGLENLADKNILKKYKLKLEKCKAV